MTTGTKFEKLDKLAKEMLKIVEADDELAMMLHIGQYVDENSINGYSIDVGNSIVMVNALYVDLVEQIENENFSLYLEISEMMSAIEEEYGDVLIGNAEPNGLPKLNKILH